MGIFFSGGAPRGPLNIDGTKKKDPRICMNFTNFFGILLGIKWAQIVLGVKLLSICEISKKKLGLQPYGGGFYDLLKILCPGQNKLASRRRKFEFRAISERKLGKLENY